MMASDGSRGAWRTADIANDAGADTVDEATDAARDDATSGASGGTTSTEAAAEDDEMPLSKDELFHLLQNGRRRAVVRYLEGRDEPVPMRDVAEQVTAWENDTTVDRITSKQRQRVYIALYQSHLSTLDEAGVINYNQPRGIVEPTPLVDHVAKYVEASSPPENETSDDGWERRYLGVSIVGSLLLFGVTFDVTVFQFISSFAASVLILAMFSFLTLVRLWTDPESRAR